MGGLALAALGVIVVSQVLLGDALNRLGVFSSGTSSAALPAPLPSSDLHIGHDAGVTAATALNDKPIGSRTTETTTSAADARRRADASAQATDNLKSRT